MAVTDPDVSGDANVEANANPDTVAHVDPDAGTAVPPRRLGQVIRLRPEHAEEYLRLHREVWPDVLAMITACNIRNYSIYLHGDLLFACFEYVGADFAADAARMAADPATQRWWALTDPCQEQVPGAAAGEWWTTLPEVFHHD